MIEYIKIKNLKGFKDYRVDFTRLNLLVGGNNCGKTTVFHTLQIFFWCVDQTADVTSTGAEIAFRKTQVPEVGAIPYFNARDLFHNQKVRAGNKPARIELSLKASGIPELSFSIYTAFSRNLMVDGAEQRITRAQYEQLLALKPVYVPGTIGITVREEMYRTIAQERLILEGRQNQVLRNLVYRLSKEEKLWAEFVKLTCPLFQLQDMNVPFDESKDEWLTAVYKENGCEFDFVSAGSGFLQVINLLSFLFLHTSRVALLDEPDSHMHDDLQKLTFDILDKLSKERAIQLIIATHSPTLIDAAGLENVLLIDRKHSKPLQAQETDTLVPLLSDRGISLPPAKVMNTLKSRKVLFVEGAEDDYDDFIQQLGEVYWPGFRALVRGLTVFETKGATQKWPFDAIACFEKLLGVPLCYVFVSDRDFLTDDQLSERGQRASEERVSLLHLLRRNREAYLLEPVILSRLLNEKWRQKQPDVPAPDTLSESAIKEFILSEGRLREADTRSELQLAQDPYQRLPAEERKHALLKMTQYFDENYVAPLSRGDIPYKLLDAKAVLKKLRAHIAATARISFSDKELVQSFQRSELPQEIKVILERIKSFFEKEMSKVKVATQPLLLTVPD